jgi:hypothetical protein
MKLSLLLLFVSTSAVTVYGTISGDISDTAVCGDVIIQADCSFEADPDRRRRRQIERSTPRTRGTRKLGGKNDDSDQGADGFINSCTVMLDGEEVPTTIKDLDYALVNYDEDVKGDDVYLELFQSLVSVENTTITGLFKLETFEYDIPNAAQTDDDRQTTLKTFSVAWAGCA